MSSEINPKMSNEQILNILNRDHTVNTDRAVLKCTPSHHNPWSWRNHIVALSNTCLSLQNEVEGLKAELKNIKAKLAKDSED